MRAAEPSKHPSLVPTERTATEKGPEVEDRQGGELRGDLTQQDWRDRMELTLGLIGWREARKKEAETKVKSEEHV